MASYKNLFIFIFLMFATTQADDIYQYEICSKNKTTAGSTFESNVKRLLSSLASNSLSNTGFYNTTVPGDIPSDSVFGMFMCRGDVPGDLCQKCVQYATQTLSAECSLSKEAVMWIDECMVRFSNRSSFSIVDTRPRLCVYTERNASDQESFLRLVFDNLNKTADEAAGGNREKMYATSQTDITENRTLYSLAQCTPDLSPNDCRRCLGVAIGELPLCCQGNDGGIVLYPSCNVRYSLYPYYLSPMPTSARVPASNFSVADSSYLYHNCTTNATADSTYIMHLKTLLFYLSSNATNRNKFYMGVENTVYGLFMCRGDLHSRLCEQCVLNATQRISSDCGSFQEAIIWYSDCMLRYSNRDFFFQVEKTPNFQMLNVTTISNPVPGQAAFTFILSKTLLDLANEASKSEEKYATKSSKLNDLQTLYTLAQCTQDLNDINCENCLEDLHGKIPWSHLGSIGGRVLYPSCNLGFELFPFYGDGYEAQSPMPVNLSPLGLKEKRKIQSQAMILISVLAIVSVILFSFAYYLIRRKVRKSTKMALRENFGHESATLEPLQFSLDLIEAATNNFSNDNKIGKGGFGEVYKGILLDGRQIAVKRLSKSSNQGANEFRNEVLLIAKLQHRNLVAFIGFCLEEQEKLLIYEYVPNKSLDYFLFDSQRSKLLSWHERYDIIGGVARGILYLHEHSRLKVIHRDLKPSNVLLDQNMNPKISDFGLARIVDINQDQGSTNRIVGTFGYMSPEYAMCGQFSEKSDVFSFGVMVLEIISGKKNLSSCEPHGVANSLLSYVWRQWRSETPLSILDSSIKEQCSKLEVIRCIQIGLLCIQQNPDDRPSMVQVVSYLSSPLIALPSPQNPALFLHGRIYSKSFGQESSSSQSINEYTSLSNNDISISEFFPR